MQITNDFLLIWTAGANSAKSAKSQIQRCCIHSL